MPCSSQDHWTVIKQHFNTWCYEKKKRKGNHSTRLHTKTCVFSRRSQWNHSHRKGELGSYSAPGPWKSSSIGWLTITTLSWPSRKLKEAGSENAEQNGRAQGSSVSETASRLEQMYQPLRANGPASVSSHNLLLHFFRESFFCRPVNHFQTLSVRHLALVGQTSVSSGLWKTVERSGWPRDSNHVVKRRLCATAGRNARIYWIYCTQQLHAT